MVRAVSLTTVVASTMAVAVTSVPAKLPAAALGSVLVLYVERLVIVLAALLFVAVAAVRGWRGDLPESLSEKGAAWGPLDRQQETTQERLAALVDEVQELRQSVALLRRHLFLRR